MEDTANRIKIPIVCAHCKGEGHSGTGPLYVGSLTQIPRICPKCVGSGAVAIDGPILEWQRSDMTRFPTLQARYTAIVTAANGERYELVAELPIGETRSSWGIFRVHGTEGEAISGRAFASGDIRDGTAESAQERAAKAIVHVLALDELSGI